MTKTEPRSTSRLSTIRKSTAGYEFDESSDNWMLDGSITVHLSFLQKFSVEEKTAVGFRKSLSRFAQDLSASYCKQITHHVRRFFKISKENNFSAEALSDYKATLDEKSSHYLGVIRSFLDSWYEWEYPGISEKTIKYLDELTIKGMEKGVAVLTNCPYSGPYTSMEHESLIFGLANAYEIRSLSQHEYSFLLAVSMTGQRPVQIRYLKFSDLGFEDKAGARVYYLDVPRAKQRGENRFRFEFKRITICKELFDALNDQRNEVISWVEREIGSVENDVEAILPLFPEYKRLGTFEPSTIESHLNNDFLHMTARSTVELLRKLNANVIAHSERTGERLNIGFTRLRRTFATNLAAEGFGPLVIAEALSHSDTQQVHVYARSEPASLAIDSLIEEDGRLKVLWYSKKKANWTKKIVPVVLEPTVREAFARLIKIGAPARKAAKFAFENPNKFMRHSGCVTPCDFREDQPLNALEFACATCLSTNVIDQLQLRQQARLGPGDRGAWKILGANTSGSWLKTMLSSGPITYQRLAARTLAQYKNHSWPNIAESTRPVWDSLVLVLDRQFHSTFEAKQFSWVIPNINALNVELGGKNYETRASNEFRLSSIFERFGKVDEDGATPIELTSHQLRVWLSTWAERGGMDAWQLAQWAGRARIADNKAYGLMKQSEKDRMAKAVLMLKKTPTAIQAVNLNLPVTYQSLGIDRIGVAHATLYGYCVRDWAMAPCLKGGGNACAGCDDHKCIKGLDGKLENLEALESGLSRELVRAALEIDAETFGANNWYRFIGFRLAKVRTLIALLKNPDTPIGAVVGVPPEFDSSPLQRARAVVVPGASMSAQQTVVQGMTMQLVG